MNKFAQKLIFLILIIIFILAFSSSYFSLSMDNLAYVLAIGLDKSDQNKLEVTFQFSTTIPTSESGSSQKASSVINSVHASSISTAINLLNGYMGKELNMSHCKVIIFSEELASEGISDEIYTLINDTQVRPSANIIVTNCSAKYYIEKTTPELESLIAKYYEIFTNSSKYSGFMPDATIGTFFNSLICKTCSPTAILGGLNTNNNDNSNNNSYAQDYNIKASQSSITGKNGTENIGTAVFNNDKLVGELNALETTIFLNINNKINRFLVSIPDPINKNKYLDIYLTPKGSTNIKVDTSNSSPYIELKISYTGKIYSMNDNSQYLNTEVLDVISKTCNSYLESTFTHYLYKTSKELKSDINGFGKHALSTFLTTQDFENYNWLYNYKNAFFKVKIETYIKSGMLITET